ncbi:PTH1 family peptidyl-tRNA hydrolase [Mycoplasma testudineum]|uniref:Peptidyl-tRNA hydrolase n=1 Tax=Mycoplasma testudineum TaxID=244584 RepID=A0A4R6IC93_9MOLU|nr:aminoacyl-tRNA hydrolase [Mycoplasma testudineum]OYD26727.1 aminoacyl-tRNA hydrolase [Mycoplasma testudineum]TDO19863.1 PTH1 family peptidyl-tRNA hydrolase [Mycoplasma testudineum]
MKLVIGLGNPGNEYLNTKHNVGFNVLDLVAKKLNVEINKEKFEGLYYKGHNVILAKPQTYMNNSGKFVKAICNFYNIDINDVLVVYDDMDFPVGKAVIKGSGSSGGQKGMDSIIKHLGTQDIKRIRIGIGRPGENHDVSNYVLSKFTEEQQTKMNLVLDSVSETVLTYIFNDIKVAVNHLEKK